MNELNKYEKSLLGDLADSVLPCDLKVHHGLFHVGVNVSTAQVSINRLSDYVKELEVKCGDDKKRITKLEAVLKNIRKSANAGIDFHYNGKSYFDDILAYCKEATKLLEEQKNE